jgi:hypothetical protein
MQTLWSEVSAATVLAELRSESAAVMDDTAAAACGLKTLINCLQFGSPSSYGRRRPYQAGTPCN